MLLYVLGSIVRVAEEVQYFLSFLPFADELYHSLHYLNFKVSAAGVFKNSKLAWAILARLR